MPILISTVIWLILLWGRRLAKINLRAHIFAMLTVILADTLLVAYLALQRDVVGTVTQKMTLLLAIHIAAALTTLVFYYYSAYCGMRLLRGTSSFRKRLQFMDPLIVVFRTITLATSAFL